MTREKPRREGGGRSGTKPHFENLGLAWMLHIRYDSSLMSLLIDTDIKKVVRLAHQKGVLTAAFLRRQGVSYQRMLKYRKGGWLSALGTGAFSESGTTPTFEMAIAALSEQLGLPVHLGGKTALLRHGIVQHLPLGGHMSELYLSRGFQLPKWFCDTYGGQFVRNSSHLVADDTGLDREDNGVVLSSPERAFLEVAAQVPKKTALGELYQLMEFAETLRPKLLTDLLVRCGSIKAKRVFLFLADDLGHWWAKKIDHSAINLGNGCRVIDKGGEFQAKYNIVVRPWRET